MKTKKMALLVLTLALFISVLVSSTGVLASDSVSKDQEFQEQFVELKTSPAEPFVNNQGGFQEVFVEGVDVDLTKMDIDKSAVNENVDLNLARGKSWEKSFNTRRAWGRDDNTVYIGLTSVTSGKFKVIVTGSNGYYAESEEQIGDYNTAIEKTNRDVTYTVTVVNTAGANVKARLSVYSYHKE